MRSEDLYRGMSGIDDAILKRCMEPVGDKRRKVHYRQWIAVAACVCLVVFGTIFEPWQRFGGASGQTTGDGPAASKPLEEDVKPTRNFFVITANAAELSNDVEYESGDVYGLTLSDSTQGMCSGYILDYFSIGGQNIEKVTISVDKNELYTCKDIYEGDDEWPTEKQLEETYTDYFTDAGYYNQVFDRKEMTETGHREWKYHYEYWRIVGDSYEAPYDDELRYGFFVRDALNSFDVDYDAQVDMMNDARLTVGVTYLNGEYEEHHYCVKTGRVIYESTGGLYGERGSRILSQEEYEGGELGFVYSWLLEQID